jgi:hypothetical protein
MHTVMNETRAVKVRPHLCPCSVLLHAATSDRLGLTLVRGLVRSI